MTTPQRAIQHTPPLESTAALRTLIQNKRAHGQEAAALVLAQLGSHIAAQEKDGGKRDDLSRQALMRYLELMPDDPEVRKVLEQLQREAPRKFKKPRLWVWLFALFGLMLAGGLHFYGATLLPEPLPAQVIVVRLPPKILPPPAPVEPIIIRAVGDVVLGSDFPQRNLPNREERKRLLALHDELRRADVVIGNLEGVLSDGGNARKDVSLPNRFAFRMPESYAGMLREMGFDVLSLANNHSLDFGQAGLDATVRVLKEAGVQPVGVPGADIAFIKVRNTNIAFLNYSYLPAFGRLDNAQRISNEIGHAHSLADMVVVSVHGGTEGSGAIGSPKGDEYYQSEYRGDLKRFAYLAVEAGADAVFGHGPHVVRPFEVYKDKPIFYSLGNFVGYHALSTQGRLANSIIAEIKLTPEGKLLAAGIVPLKLDGAGIPASDYSPNSLQALDLLLEEQLKKSPVLSLNWHAQSGVNGSSSFQSVASRQ